MNIQLITLIFISLTIHSFSIENCEKFFQNIIHEFHPLRHCQRSNKSIIAYTNVDTIQQCKVFTRNNFGLAFNFSPKNRSKSNEFEKKSQNDTKKIEDTELLFNCQALACPEHKNLSTLVNDTRFDYYTMYAYPLREFWRKFFENIFK
jgi:hypothetical protein